MTSENNTFSTFTSYEKWAPRMVIVVLEFKDALSSVNRTAQFSVLRRKGMSGIS